MTTQNIASLLALSVSPVILISAVGLIVLTLNNRLATSINRIRLLVKESEGADEKTHQKMAFEIKVIYRRAELIRKSITCITASALSSALLIISLFLTALFGKEVLGLYSVFFVASLGFLIAGLVYFLLDVNDALVALREEIDQE